MTATIQRSFAGGVLDPAVHARADLIKYATGLAICLNFHVDKHGGVSNRAGTEFLGEVVDNTKVVALLGFEFSEDQTYILEFGEYYMRVIRNGAILTIAAPAAWVTSTGYSARDLVSNGGERYYCIADHTSSASDEPGVGANWQDYWWQMPTGTDYAMPTPYAEADLVDLNYVQSADVMTICHPSHSPRDVSRYGHTDWGISETPFEPTHDRPTNLSASAGGAGSNTYRYAVTAVKKETLEESARGIIAGNAITSVSGNGSTTTLTFSATHPYAVGDTIYLTGLTGSAVQWMNNREFTVATTPTGTTLTLENSAWTGSESVTANGHHVYYELTSAAAPSVGSPHTITWTQVADTLEYIIYKESDAGVFGYIGVATQTTFDDPGIDPNTADTPPIYRNPFFTPPASSGNNPSAVGYYQQRRVFGNSNNNPEKVWASQPGAYNNFSIRSPLQPDDAVTWTIAGRKVSQIRNFVELDRLIVMNSSAEHLIEGDVDGVLRPGSVNPRKQSENGSAKLPPMLISNSIIYLQSRGNVIREIKVERDRGYVGQDLTVFASHLFENYTIVSMAFQQTPNSILWCVRNDGVLLGMTYLPEHEIWGWHTHETDGHVENVQVVPEGGEDMLYLVVRRNINGADKRYIERLASRKFTDIAIDAFFVDSGLSWDGRNTNGSHTMTLSGGTLWTNEEDLILTSSTSYFVAADVGNAVHLKLVDVDGNITDTLKCNIIGYTSGTVVTVNTNKDVPVGFQNVALSDWGMAVDEFAGLDHLEGKIVSILSDGNVETQQTVTSGQITIATPGEIVHIGLPITSDFQTLDIDIPDGEPLANKLKLVQNVTMHVKHSRGIWAGQSSDELYEYPQREFEDWGEPTQLKTGKVNIGLSSTWDDNGRVFVRQTDPLPLSILSVIPEGMISEGN